MVCRDKKIWAFLVEQKFGTWRATEIHGEKERKALCVKGKSGTWRFAGSK
jgi:hypothetical protein